MANDTDTLVTLLESNNAAIGAIHADVKETRKELGRLNTTVAVMTNAFQTQVSYCTKRFTENDEKFSRDYKRINDLEKEKAIKNGIKAHETEKKEGKKYLIYAVATILSILIMLNTIWSLAERVHSSPAQQTHVTGKATP